MQYDKVVTGRQYVEEDEDFHTMKSMDALTTMYPIEKQTGECYIKNLFSMF